MKKTKNRSGFTLIELIIVVALLSIMLGAILRLIDPIRNVYHDTLDTVNTKTVGETMISFIEDKTRYSTNMLILRDYKGVPKLTSTNTETGAARVGNCSCEFTDVIIIDNHNLRGFGLTDYQGSTATLATRKNCTGTIYTMSKIGESAKLDLSKLNTGTIGDDVYGPYSYNVECDVKVLANTRKTLNFSVESYPMEVSGSAYHKATNPEYKAERYFDLVNINLDRPSYNISDNIDFAATDDYSKYPQETSAPSSLTDEQKSFFGTGDDNRFTYIFYKVNKTNETQSYEVKFMVSPEDTVASWAGKVLAKQKIKAGEKIPVDFIPTIPTRTGYLFSQFEVDNAVIAEADIPNYVINNDTTFIVRYGRDTSVKEYALIFYDADGSLVPGTYKLMDGDVAASCAPSPTYDSLTQYYEWRLDSTTGMPIELFTPGSASSYNFYAVVKNKYKIEFKDEDGNVIDTQYVKNKGEINLIGVPESKDPLKTAGEWVVNGTNYGSATIDSDAVITPKYMTISSPVTPPSTSGASFAIDEVQANSSTHYIRHDDVANMNVNNDQIQLSIKIKNTGTAASSKSTKYKVEVKFNEKIKSTVLCYYTPDGHSITVKDDYTVVYEFSGSEITPNNDYTSTNFTVFGDTEKFQGEPISLAVASSKIL